MTTERDTLIEIHNKLGTLGITRKQAKDSIVILAEYLQRANNEGFKRGYAEGYIDGFGDGLDEN